MGDHMPVHLGSMPMSVRAAINKLSLARGDAAILNDPFCGGTHLPDITLVAPCSSPQRNQSVLHFMLLPAPIMLTWAEPIPAPWASAAKSFRKACAFRPSS